MLLTRSSPIVELVCLTGTRPPSGRRRGDVPGLAVDEVLADERLRAYLAGRVLAQVGLARLGDLGVHHGHGMRLPLQVHVPGLADLDAGDLEVAAVG